jgi:hypothetical protein
MILCAGRSFNSAWKRSCQLAARVAVVCILTAGIARSENTVTEFWPEVDTFFSLSEHLRFIVSAKKERDVDFSNAEFGTDLELSVSHFRPFLLGRLIELDATRAKRLTVRAGYRYKRSLNTGVPVNENRPTAEFTLRWVFGEGILMSNRARGELRFVNGAFSWRYRDLLKIDKEFHLRHYELTVYASAEAFYNSATSTWDRFRFSGGMLFPLGKRFAAEPYYTRQIATHSNPRNIDAVGLIFQMYLLK